MNSFTAFQQQLNINIRPVQLGFFLLRRLGGQRHHVHKEPFAVEGVAVRLLLRRVFRQRQNEGVVQRLG